MKFRKVLVTIIVILMAAVVVIGAYVMINRKNAQKSNAEEEVTISKVQEVLYHNLEKNYPPTPKEVLKFYSELTICFYNPDIVEEDMEKLALKARELYDDELLASQPEGEYVENVKNDILSFQSQNLVISGYSVSPAVDVEYFSQDGYEWARLYATYRLRQGTEYIYSNEVFLLRKDENKHWKIYGWALVQEDESAEGQNE